MPRILLLDSTTDTDAYSNAGLSAWLMEKLPRDRYLFSRAALPVRPWYRLRAGEWAKRLSEWVGFGPHLIHAIGPFACHAAYWLRRLPKLGFPKSVPLVMSEPVQVPTANRLKSRRCYPVRLARDAEALTVHSLAEAEWLAGMGLNAERLTAIPPIVPMVSQRDRQEMRRLFQVPHTSRLILAVGHFEPFGSLSDAVFAFDIFRYAEPNTALIFAGTGPDRERAVRYANSVDFDSGRIRFAPADWHRHSLLASADLVWVADGPTAAVDALAAFQNGRPFIAPRLPALDGLFPESDFQTTVESGDRIALAKATGRILAKVGLSGRSTEKYDGGQVDGFSSLFGIERVAESFQTVYDTVLLKPSTAEPGSSPILSAALVRG